MTMVVVMMSSCNFLDVEPRKSVTFTNYFKSESEIEAIFLSMLITEKAIFATQSPLAHEMMGLKCDDIYGYSSQIQGNVALMMKDLDPSVFLHKSLDGDMSWSSAYSLVYYANMLRDNAFRFENITEQRKEFWLAQASFVKGLAYFQIAREWGDAPIVPHSEFKDRLAKSDVVAVLQEAIKAAEAALVLPLNTESQMVDSRGRTITSKQYASRGTVYTLLANIYAWLGGLYPENNEYWTKSESYASEVIDGRAGSYMLEGNHESLCINAFGQVRNSPEVIFGIEISSLDRDYYHETFAYNFCPGHLLITYPVVGLSTDVDNQYGASGRIASRISRETVLSLYNDPADNRRNEYWYELSKSSVDGLARNYAYIYKWRTAIISLNEDAGKPYLGIEGNKPIWRLADLILLRAECRARLGRADAYNDLNRVRARAGLGDYTGGNVRMEIFRERERELFGEGHRYFDAVRNGYLDEISTVVGNLTDSEIDMGALYLPVAQGAFSNNNIMRQNKYWLWKK